eukprot:CAMPEP_0115335598 /NCGR_PEP_ID=MMETSP0270-20121206/88549_1 /TAXON_ID=71861 /ORGANISM="Scrippsiella trochoidea, Strain CCMP3099" /LENGTH=59 /DNA_ID=CAMNT_0002756697 /DNA_START=70 /DNA_END=245 /DNA_ORIENTATION=+
MSLRSELKPDPAARGFYAAALPLSRQRVRCWQMCVLRGLPGWLVCYICLHVHICKVMHS